MEREVLSKLENGQSLEALEAELEKEQAQNIQKLEKMLSGKAEIQLKLKALVKKLEGVSCVESEVQTFAEVVNVSARLAEDVSGKVRQLDKAKNRVSLCQQRVNDLLDLQQCSLGVATAMQNEDYEKAAAHVHRFLFMDEDVLKHSAKDVSEGQNIDVSFHKLHDAELKLKEVVRAKFEEAVKQEDLASVDRFFKIFPLLNMHGEGLSRYTSYLGSKIRSDLQKNLSGAKRTSESDKRFNVIFADTLTLLFESLARTIEIHQPLIETYYGPGRMFTLVKLLQAECDYGCEEIINQFKRTRDFNKKVQLVSSFMNNKTETKINPIDLDLVLNEVTLLNARTELYSKFIKKLVMNDLDVATTDEDEKENVKDKLAILLKSNDTFKIVQDILGQYILLEQYFMAQSVQKAVEMDKLVESTTDDTFVMSSMTDDVFFIVKKCIKRSLTSQSVDGICAVINNACGILESDFADLLLNQLRQGFPSGYLDLAQAYNVLQSFQQGKFQGSDIEKSRTLFVAYLNNTDVSMEYVTALRNTLENSIQDSLGANLTTYEKEKIANCLSGLSQVNIRLKSVSEFGFSQLRSSAVKPRVKPWIDNFLHFRPSYELRDDDFMEESPSIEALVADLRSFTKSFRSCLSPNSFETFVSLMTGEISNQLEKGILKIKFNRIGGLQFDKELRVLINYLTNTTTWSARDKFTRLSQITILLTIEKISELSDYWGKGPVTWRLTPQEVKQVLLLRTDFRSDDVKRLKL